MSGPPLRSEHEALSKLLDEKNWFLGGARITGMNISPKKNAVEVLIDPIDAGQASSLAQALSGKPVRIRIEKTATKWKNVARNSYPPLWGGATIVSQYFCTTAFGAIRYGGVGVTTAGHCGGIDSYWYMSGGGSYIGRMGVRSNGGYADAGYIANGNAQGNVHVNDSSKHYRPVHFAWGDGVPEGATVYVSDGKSDTTYWQPGGLENWSATSPAGIWDSQSSYLCGQSGDSGSPVYTVNGDGSITAGGILNIMAGPGDQPDPWLAGCQPGERAWWTRLNRADAALGTGTLAG